MKNVIYAIVMGVSVLLIIIAVMVLNGRIERENDMENALSVAVDQAIESLIDTNSYDITDNELFVADFNEALLSQLNDGGDRAKDKNLKITVAVTGVDAEKGLLSVHVIEEFTHLNGNIGIVSCDATVVLEAQEEKELHTITYYVNGSIYKAYQCTEGESFKRVTTDPTSPDGKRFAYWKDDETGFRAIFPNTVTKDKSYTAVFR